MLNFGAIFIIWFTVGPLLGLSTQPTFMNSLNGQNLHVIWPSWVGNPIGLTGPLKGGVILEYLSNRFNFTYEMLRVTEDKLELQYPVKGKMGLFDYLANQKCDLLLQDVPPSSRRMGMVDLTQPWTFAYLIFLIPIPDNTANINAIIKPFQWPVWISLTISIICVILTLIKLDKLLKISKSFNSGSATKSKSETLMFASAQTFYDKRVQSRKFITDQHLYVFGNLLSQGGPCKSNRLSFRVVAGAWCLAAFIFSQAYTSILFTYVVTPVSSPLIQSVYDVIENTDINMFVTKGGDLDRVFQNNSEVELFKKLRKKLDSVPSSRCNFKSECIDLITPGTRNVYLDSIYFQMDAIKEHFKSTGKCNLQLSRNGFINLISTFALPKNSRHTKTISQGLLELQEIGLIDYWDLWFRPMPAQCMANLKSGYQTSRKVQKYSLALSFKNLTGAFVVLLVGVGISLFAFVSETVVHQFNNR